MQSPYDKYTEYDKLTCAIHFIKFNEPNHPLLPREIPEKYEDYTLVEFLACTGQREELGKAISKAVVQKQLSDNRNESFFTKALAYLMKGLSEEKPLSVELCKNLIDLGANPAKAMPGPPPQNSILHYAIMAAIINKNFEIFTFLVKTFPGHSELGYALFQLVKGKFDNVENEKLLECCELLLKYNAPAILEPSTHNTPLHIAIETKNIALIDKMLAYHFPFRSLLSVRNAKGETPLAMAFKTQNWDIVYKLLPFSCKHTLFIYDYLVIENGLDKLIKSKDEAIVNKIVNIIKDHSKTWTDVSLKMIESMIQNRCMYTAFGLQEYALLPALISWGANPFDKNELYQLCLIEILIKNNQFDALKIIFENFPPNRHFTENEKNILTTLVDETSLFHVGVRNISDLIDCLYALSKTGVSLPAPKNSILHQAIQMKDSASLRLCFAFHFLDLTTTEDALVPIQINPAFFMREFFKFACVPLLLLPVENLLPVQNRHVAQYISQILVELTIAHQSKSQLSELVLGNRIEKFLNSEELSAFAKGFSMKESSMIRSRIESLRLTPATERKNYIDNHFLTHIFDKRFQYEKVTIALFQLLKSLGLGDQISVLEKQYDPDGSIKRKKEFLAIQPFYQSSNTITGYLETLKKANDAESINQCTYDLLERIYQGHQEHEKSRFIASLVAHDLANTGMMYELRCKYMKYETSGTGEYEIKIDKQRQLKITKHDQFKKRKYALLKEYEANKMTAFEFSATIKMFVEKIAGAYFEVEMNTVVNEFLQAVISTEQQGKYKDMIGLLIKHGFYNDAKIADIKPEELPEKIESLLSEFKQIRWGLFTTDYPDILTCFMKKLSSAKTVSEVSTLGMAFLDGVFLEEVSKEQYAFRLKKNELCASDLSVSDVRCASMISGLWKQGFVDSSMISEAREHAIEEMAWLKVEKKSLG